MFNLLLQVMDHGTLTDNNGRKADFRHVIIVMTTNAGAQEMARPTIGFTQADNTSDGMEAIRRIFSPEFRNRLDAVIQFAALDPATIERVVDKLILEVEAQLEQKGVSITLDDAARRWIADQGLRSEDGCPADGAHHPGAHQAAAGGGAAVRAPGERRLCARHGHRRRQGACAGVRAGQDARGDRLGYGQRPR